jgi:hypothetical protein
MDRSKSSKNEQMDSDSSTHEKQDAASAEKQIDFTVNDISKTIAQRDMNRSSRIEGLGAPCSVRSTANGLLHVLHDHQNKQVPPKSTTLKKSKAKATAGSSLHDTLQAAVEAAARQGAARCSPSSSSSKDVLHKNRSARAVGGPTTRYDNLSPPISSC